MLLGYTVAKVPASPRNSTWFTRPFLLVRGWGMGTILSKLELRCSTSVIQIPGLKEKQRETTLDLLLCFPALLIRAVAIQFIAIVFEFYFLIGSHG